MRHLFVVAHPDDEVLGAGAVIYDAVKRGDEVAAVILNTKDTTRYIGVPSGIVSDLRKSHDILGIQRSAVRLAAIHLYILVMWEIAQINVI